LKGKDEAHAVLGKQIGDITEQMVRITQSSQQASAAAITQLAHLAEASNQVANNNSAMLGQFMQLVQGQKGYQVCLVVFLPSDVCLAPLCKYNV